MVAVGKALIVTLVVVVFGHVPFVKLYVTVYVPVVLVAKSICPVVALIERPAVEV